MLFSDIFLFQNNPACFAPLGMEDGTITDAQVSASTRLDDNHSPSQARLNFKADGNKAGGWSALTSDLNQWLQVDLASYTRVTHVATQGMNANNELEWVTRYKLQYSDDGITFQFYRQLGGSPYKVCQQSGLAEGVPIYNTTETFLKRTPTRPSLLSAK